MKATRRRCHEDARKSSHFDARVAGRLLGCDGRGGRREGAGRAQGGRREGAGRARVACDAAQACMQRWRYVQGLQVLDC
jgi:hypothetical protein